LIASVVFPAPPFCEITAMVIIVPTVTESLSAGQDRGNAVKLVATCTVAEVVG
jgi:hypothetical protein